MAHTVFWDTNQTFTSTLDGPMVEKIIPGNLIIKAGVTVTVSNRCKGLHIQVMGNCFIYGTIDMTAKGGNIAGQNVGLEFYSDRNKITLDDAGWSSLPTVRKIPAVGASGVQVGLYTSDATSGTVTGITGNAGTDGKCGAGGSGSLSSYKTNGWAYTQMSGPGTSFSGGPGSGGIYNFNPAGTYGGVVGANGGAGGSGYTAAGASYGSGGGAGNPGGVYNGLGGYTGESGAGGLLVLSVLGYLFINSGAVIKSNGKNGGAVYGITSELGAGAGGGSGGGSINILYGALTNNGTLQANGGIGGAHWGSYKGGDGGAGSIRYNSLRTT